mgnify:CR=1 FL=1
MVTSLWSLEWNNMASLLPSAPIIICVDWPAGENFGAFARVVDVDPVGRRINAGDTVVVPNADVLRFGDGQTFANAAALAAALVAPLTAIKFASLQTNTVNHYVVAYDDTSGNLRIADLDIHNPVAFDNTSQVQSLAISDMIQLAGVSVVDLNQSNIHFVA